MHDTVIRGGTIVDGSGEAKFTGDVAIDDGMITAVGGKAGPAKRDIEADGQTVTPGWVDIHTHYDGQATWDPELAPSSWHGSTTVLFGNCGVGFAPARPEHREALIELMEGVEDIPNIALSEGLKWDWETFPEYLDALERTDRTIDIAAQMPHHALRVYTMGDRAINREAARADDIADMRNLTAEALRAGAFGFTTSRTDQHKTPSGEMVPGRYSEVDELLGIGAALGDVGGGAFGLISDFEDEASEFDWITKQGQQSNRPVWFLLTDRSYDPKRYRRLMDGAAAAREVGAPVTPQVAGRPVGLILGLECSLSPFSIRPTYKELMDLPFAERLAKLRNPDIRAKILSEEVDKELLAILPPLTQQIATRWDRTYVLGDPPNYEPEAERSVAVIAEREGRSPQEVAYDHLTGGDGTQKFFFPVTNYVAGDLNAVHDMITDPNTLLGLSDGGAHCGVICDASVPSFMLTHWVRDRSRGPKVPLEWMVKRQTSETAKFFGFNDRGLLKPGMKADVNVIDLENLRLHAPRIVNDLPAGGKRLIQNVDGYSINMVSGQPIFERGEITGARPGKLVRAGH